MSEDNNNRRSDSAPAQPETSDQEYKVGPGRPPKEYRFKPGQSGNPKGAKRKPTVDWLRISRWRSSVRSTRQ